MISILPQYIKNAPGKPAVFQRAFCIAAQPGMWSFKRYAPHMLQYAGCPV